MSGLGKGFGDVVQQAQEQARQQQEKSQKHEDETETETTALLSQQESSQSQQSRYQEKEAQRTKALEHVGVGRAAFLIRDAVLGLVENPADGAYDPYDHPESPRLNTISTHCRRLCSSRSFRHFINGVVWILVLLTFVEPPTWCNYMVLEGELLGVDYFLDKGRCPEFMTKQGPPAGGSSAEPDVFYYPNTSTIWLTVRESHAVEFACLLCLWLYVWLRIGRDGLSLRRYFRPSAPQMVRILEFTAMIFLTIGLVYDTATTMDHERVFAPYLRIILLITLHRDVMRELKTLVSMMPEVANILFLLFLFIAFYAWIGVVAFYGSDEGKQMFPNIVDAMFTLWIATTTANYPDLMMPVYNTNRLSALYFILFMGVTFFFLMNVILASVVNAYDNEIDNRRVERSKQTATSFGEAFQLMDPNDEGTIDRDTVMALFLILNEDFPEFRTIPRDEARLLFAILDRDGSNFISLHEFMDFGNVLMLEFEKITLRKTLIQECFPRVYESVGFKAFSTFIESNTFDFAIDNILVLNAVVVFIQSYPMLMGESVDVKPSIGDGAIDTVWEVLETGFTAIYVVEISIKILVKGWQEFSKSSRHLFDMTITLLAVFASAYVYYPNEFSDSRLIRFIVMARVLRLTRLLVLSSPFQMIARIAIDVFARAKVVLKLLFCVLYVFAALGVQVFGGLISRDPKDPRSFLLLGSEFAENEYWANNFNDMFGALNVLFNLLVVNNWTECQNGFEAVTQKRYNRLYFIFFHIVGVVLVNNLVLAFIINAFIKQWDYRQEQLKTTIIRGEAVIVGRHAIFDARQVTGTTTELTGQYTAKIRRRRTSFGDGEHQQRILKSMFTSSSHGENDPNYAS